MKEYLEASEVGNDTFRGEGENSEEVKAAFAVGGMYTEGSGVTRVVCDLANALACRGTAVDVYTADCPGRGADGRGLFPPNRLCAAPGRWMGRLAWSPALKHTLDEAVPYPDVLHNHSLWMLPTSYATEQRHLVAVVECSDPSIDLPFRRHQ